jgi:hypothetical protein
MRPLGTNSHINHVTVAPACRARFAGFAIVERPRCRKRESLAQPCVGARRFFRVVA